MTAEIYYFSGTGNSLAVAMDISKRLNGKLISIPSMMNKENIIINADRIGIVFPDYYETYGGIPLIVRRFVGRLENIKAKYIFAVCTYGSGMISALGRLDKMIRLRGGKLAAGFAVDMPPNLYPHLAIKKFGKMFDVWKKKLDFVCGQISKKKKGRFQLPNSFVGRAYHLFRLIGFILLPLFKKTTLRHLQEGAKSGLETYEELLPLMDNSFQAGEKCGGCGICAKICPVENIVIADGKPSWLHRCEFCLACYHWCPEEAISCSVLENSLKYHHPDVKISDFMKN